MSFARIIAAAVTIAGAGMAQAQAQDDTITAAVLEIGTVNWELDTITHYGLDAENGFKLDVQGMAGSQAAQLAFQTGAVDMIASDWIWVARQVAAGEDYIFIPYSRAVGGVLVAQDSPAQSLADLSGAKIGIAGGPLDKSWMILRAYAQQAYGMDLVTQTEQVFGAPPLIMQAGLTGEVDGAINFWHFMAKMKAGGMRELVSVTDAAEALGLDPDTPLLGYVLHGDMLRERPELVAGLANASNAAKDILANDPDAWDRLRGMMNAADDTEFEGLKAGWIAGIPGDGPVDLDQASAMLALMRDLGGAALVGDATSIPDGMFYTPVQ